MREPTLLSGCGKWCVSYEHLPVYERTYLALRVWEVVCLLWAPISVWDNLPCSQGVWSGVFVMSIYRSMREPTLLSGCVKWCVSYEHLSVCEITYLVLRVCEVVCLLWASISVWENLPFSQGVWSGVLVMSTYQCVREPTLLSGCVKWCVCYEHLSVCERTYLSLRVCEVVC